MNGVNASLGSYFDMLASPSVKMAGSGLIKLGFFVGMIIYLAFAVVVIRQVGLMTKTLHGEFEATLKLVSWLHLIVAMGIFLMSMVIL